MKSILRDVMFFFFCPFHNSKLISQLVKEKEKKVNNVKTLTILRIQKINK